jgi:hypothetical protein
MKGFVLGQRAGPPCSQSQHPLPPSQVLQKLPSAHSISYGLPLKPKSHGHALCIWVSVVLKPSHTPPDGHGAHSGRAASLPCSELACFS